MIPARSVKALLAVLAMISPGLATAGQSGDKSRLDFVEQVKDYQIYVVPRCGPEMVRAYVNANRPRDYAFVRSLRGTPLAAIYRQAVNDRAESEKHLIVHCAPWGEAPLRDDRRTPRQRAITDEQRRLRSAAEALPAFFDEGDAAFARMVAARDNILSRKEP